MIAFKYKNYRVWVGKDSLFAGYKKKALKNFPLGELLEKMILLDGHSTAHISSATVLPASIIETLLFVLVSP